MKGDAWRGLLDGLVAVLLGGGAFILYALTLAPTVLAGDGGEFQFVPYLLGVAHPTGYPLYTLLGWAWSHLLPLGDVAYRMNLFSAFWAALAVGLLYPTALRLLRQVFPDMEGIVRHLLAILAVVTFAVTPTLWSQAIMAEVYGLHIFFVTLLFYLVLSWGDRQEVERGGFASFPPACGSEVVGDPRVGEERGWLLAAALCFGLSLAHHSTTLLLAPALLAYVWLVDRRVFREWRAVLLPGLLLMFLPLLLYLYIPWRAPSTPYLRLPLVAGRELVLYENTPAEFVKFVLGGPFGGSVDLSVDYGQRLAMSWEFLHGEASWIGVILALVGVFALVLSRRWALLALTSLAYATFVAFNLVYTIGDVHVLYIPTYLVIVLWMAVGVGMLAKLAGQRRLVGFLVVVPFFALPLWMAAGRYAELDQSQNIRARQRWQAILAEPLPPDTVLVSDDRNNIMPMWYMQYVEGQRPGWLGLFPLITPDYPTLGPVLDLALSTGRPVYLIKEMPGIEVKVEVELEGRLWRVVGPAVGEEPAYPSDARLADAVALAGYDVSPGSPRPGDEMQVTLYWEALRPLTAQYHTFVHLLDPAGQKVAQSDHQPGGLYYATPIWQPGERLRDDHLLEISPGTPAGVYGLLVGFYSFAPDGTLEPLGDPVLVGQVEIASEAQH